MRTTLDLDPELVSQVLEVTNAPTKKRAIEIALKDFLRAKRREELSRLIGNYDRFGLTLEKLEKMRRDF